MINNILALILFIFLTFSSYILIKKEVYKSKLFIKSIAAFLLIYKTIEILLGLMQGQWSYYPVEFSTVFYFFLSIVLLADNKKYLPTAAAGAFVSGLGYLVAIIFNINNMLEINQLSKDSITGFLIGVLSHSILYILSLMCLAKHRFEYKREVIRINLITVIIAIHAYIVSFIIDYQGRYRFIYMLIFNEVIPSIRGNVLFMIIYYGVILGIYNLVIRFYFILNSFFHKNEKNLIN